MPSSAVRQVERVVQRRGEPLHLRARDDAFDQHGEFVAAEPRDGVRGAGGLDDTLRHRLQQPVAGIVAERVVDVLEVVEVEEHHRHRALPALRQGERVLHAVAEQVAVRQQRQRIVERHLPQLLLECLALADVAEIQCQALHRRVLREIAADALDHAALLRPLDAQLHRTDGAGIARRDLAEESPQLLAVLAHPQQRQALAGDLLGLQSEGALGGGRGEAHQPLRVHDHDDVGSVGDQRGVTLLHQLRRAPLAHQRIPAQHHRLAHHEQQREREHDHGHLRRRTADVAATVVRQHQQRRQHRGVGQRALERIRGVRAGRAPGRWLRICSRPAAHSGTQQHR